MSRSVPVDKETRTYPFSRFTTLLYQVHRANKNLVKFSRFTTLLYQVHRANKNLVKIGDSPPFCSDCHLATTLLSRSPVEDVVDAATRKRKLERWHTECERCDAAGLPKPPRPFPFYGRVGKKKSRVDGDLVHPQKFQMV